MTIDNSTGKDKEFYNLGKQMFDRIQPLKPIKPYIAAIEAEYKAQIEAAVLEEREACAKVADGWPDYDVQGLAKAIRAREQA